MKEHTENKNVPFSMEELDKVRGRDGRKAIALCPTCKKDQMVTVYSGGIRVCSVCQTMF